MKGYLVTSPIRHDGTRYTKGDFISAENLDEQSTKRLLFLNVISKAYKDEEVTPDASVETPANEISNDDGETVEEILDANFTSDELKEGAKELGLTFAGNLGKTKLINLIIENGHGDYFLDQLED